MVNKDIKLIDKTHLQKYFYLLSLFINKQIDISTFEDLFLQIRRDDGYWLSGQFDERVSKILDALFLDVSDYSPDGLFDPNDQFNINETEMRRRSSETLLKLKELID